MSSELVQLYYNEQWRAEASRSPASSSLCFGDHIAQAESTLSEVQLRGRLIRFSLVSTWVTSCILIDLYLMGPTWIRISLIHLMMSDHYGREIGDLLFLTINSPGKDKCWVSLTFFLFFPLPPLLSCYLLAILSSLPNNTH